MAAVTPSRCPLRCNIIPSPCNSPCVHLHPQSRGSGSRICDSSRDNVFESFHDRGRFAAFWAERTIQKSTAGRRMEMQSMPAISAGRLSAGGRVQVWKLSCGVRKTQGSGKFSSRAGASQSEPQQQELEQPQGGKTGLKATDSGPNDDQDPGPGFQLLASMQTPYSYINIVDVPANCSHPLAGSRIMLLDQTGNVQSIYYEDRIWTDSYWDEFAALVPLLPEGPIGFLGLAGGTAVRLVRALFPAAQLEAWEIDFIVVDMARRYFGLAQLEEATPEGGTLTVHVGDGLGEGATTEGGFAGLVVDLFAEGRVIPQLHQPETWETLKSRLRPGGRIMVNCGGATHTSSANGSAPGGDVMGPNGGEDACKATLEAFAAAFPGEVSFKVMSATDINTLAISGAFPDPEVWATALPEPLNKSCYDWRPL